MPRRAPKGEAPASAHAKGGRRAQVEADLKAVVAHARAQEKQPEKRPEWSGVVRMLRNSLGIRSVRAREIAQTCHDGIQVTDLAALWHVALMEIEQIPASSTLTKKQRAAAEAMLSPHGLTIADARIPLVERTKLRTDLLQVGLRIVEASQGQGDLPTRIDVALRLERPAQEDKGDMIDSGGDAEVEAAMARGER